MRKTIRRLAAAALALVLALSLSGCGIYFADYDNGKTKIERDENGAHEIEIMKDYIRVLENDYVIIGVSHITETYISDTEKSFSFDFEMIPKTKNLVGVNDFEWKLFVTENFAGDTAEYSGSVGQLFEPTVTDQSYHVDIDGIKIGKGCEDMIWADRLELSFGLGCQARSLEETSEGMSLTRERVRQLKMKAIHKLSSPRVRGRLAQYLL